MNNDELKKKIAQIIAEYCCPLGKTHLKLMRDAFARQTREKAEEDDGDE